MFLNLWKNKGFLLRSVTRDFKVRYMNSLLGSTWIFIQPLSLIFIYTVVFSEIMKARLPNSHIPMSYGIFLCAGILPWGFFVESLSRLLNVFIENSLILKKSSLPKFLFALSTQLTCILNFILIFSLYILFLVLVGHINFVSLIYFLPVFLIQLLFTFSLGFWLAIVNVFFRDVGSSIGVVLQFWFWATPIVYSKNVLPETALELLAFNPLSSIITAYQDIFLKQEMPIWSSLMYPSLLGTLFLILGLSTYKMRSGEMIDEL